MRTCEFCRSEIPDNATFCGICGREVRSIPKSISGNGNPAMPGQIVSNAGSNAYVANSPGRSSRKPYQYPPQPYQDQKQANAPTAAYSPPAPAGASVQQSSYYPPRVTPDPSAQPQQPVYVGNPVPSIIQLSPIRIV